MNGEAYLAAAVHLVGLAVKLGELDFRGRSWICNRDLELELVAAEIVDVQTGARPSGALRVGGGDAEPAVIVCLVHGGVGDQGAVLLLKPLRPRLAIPRPRPRREQRNLRQGRLRARLPRFHVLASDLDHDLDIRKQKSVLRDQTRAKPRKATRSPSPIYQLFFKYI